MNHATTLTAPHVWHISFDDIRKKVSRRAAAVSRLPWGAMLPLVTAVALIIAFSGILDQVFFRS